MRRLSGGATVRLEVDTDDRTLYKEILGDVGTIEWMSAAADAPRGVTVRVASAASGTKAEIPDVITIVIEHADEVATALLASWLYDRLSRRGTDRVRAIRTRRRTITLSPEGLTEAIEDELEVEKL